MERVVVYDSFDSLPESCETLFHHCSAHAGIFLSLPWFRALAAGALVDSPMRIYAVESDTDHAVRALMPMRADTVTNRFFSTRQLAAAANFYTPLFGPIVADIKPVHDGLKTLVKAIASDRERWDTVAVYPMDGDSPLYASMLSGFRSAGMAVQSYRCFANWYLKVGGRSYEEYAASLPPRLRNTLKRKAKQLSGESVRMEIITGGDELDRAIRAYQTVYQASWKQPEAFPYFVPELIRTCAREGWLRLGVAYIGDRPAAAQMWIVAGGVASIYKLAYDQEFVKYSIGSLLTAHLMRHVIDVDCVHEVDFLSGDDTYKSDWMSHRRERWGIMAFNLRSSKGLTLAVVHLGGRAVKNFLQCPLKWIRMFSHQTILGKCLRGKHGLVQD